MDSRNSPDNGVNQQNRESASDDLEARVDELENIADTLGEVPDEELVEALGRAVELLKGINSDIEANLDTATNETREIGNLLDEVNFGSFDEALQSLEKSEKEADGPV